MRRHWGNGPDDADTSGGRPGRIRSRCARRTASRWRPCGLCRPRAARSGVRRRARIHRLLATMPDVQRICTGRSNARGMGVLSPDLPRPRRARAGSATAGADEVHDIAAAVRWLRRRRLRGGSRSSAGRWAGRRCCVTRASAVSADAVVSVSAARDVVGARHPRRCGSCTGCSSRRTGRVATRVTTPHAHRAVPVRGTTLPEAPADVVGSITPPPAARSCTATPTTYFPLPHAEALAASAAPGARRSGSKPAMGHAEIATTGAELLERIAELAGRPGSRRRGGAGPRWLSTLRPGRSRNGHRRRTDQPAGTGCLRP